MKAADRRVPGHQNPDFWAEEGYTGAGADPHSLKHLARSSIEAKTDDKVRLWGNVYAEDSHQPGAAGPFYPSGFSATPAHTWVFVIEDSMVFSSVEYLKMLAEAYKDREGYTGGGNPTTGIRIPLRSLIFGIDKGLDRPPFTPRTPIHTGHHFNNDLGRGRKGEDVVQDFLDWYLYGDKVPGDYGIYSYYRGVYAILPRVRMSEASAYFNKETYDGNDWILPTIAGIGRKEVYFT